MNYISLFTGVGGFDLGFDRVGMNCVLQVEQDKHALDVLNRHWPDVPKMDDVRNVTKESTSGPVDLVCGGFPCQDVSVAGKREGLAGERSGLWSEFHRILRDLSPRWAVIENVPGLFSSNGGRDFASILRGLDELGYHVAWRVLDSQYFGVAQRRRRVFLVASLGDGCCAEVLFERTGLLGDFEESRAQGEGFTGSPQAGSGEYSAYSAADRVRGVDGPGSTLSAGGGGTGAKTGLYHVADTLRSGGRGDHPSPRTEGDMVVKGASSDGNMPEKRVVSATVTSKWAKHSGGPAGSGSECNNLTYSTPGVGDVREDNVASTMCAHSGGAGETQNPAYVQQGGVRRLTPVECCRLQGFPDDWNAWQSDAQRYRQMGNAVTVNVAEWIGGRIIEVKRQRLMRILKTQE